MEQKEIAARLEAAAKEILGMETENTLFDARRIQEGSFAEVMLLLLRKKSNYKETVLTDWLIRRLMPYLHCKPGQLPPKVMQELFEDFLFVESFF